MDTWRTTTHLILLMLVCTVVLWMSWIGFQASDDIFYYRSGLGWLQQPWFVPEGFGNIRSAVSLPISVSLAVLGDTEFAASLPTCLFVLGTVALSYLRLRKFIPPTHAFVASSLFATLPAMIIEATGPSADVAELFWSAMAFWFFVGSLHTPERRNLYLVAAGISAGIAFSAHETILGFIIFVGILFLAGFRLPRSQYWIMSVGFILVIGLESLYYLVAAGDGLHRFRTLLAGFAVAVDRLAVPAFTYDDGGTLRIWDPIDPLVMLLTKHSFGIAYYAILPVLLLIARDTIARVRRSEPNELWREVAWLAALASVVWFITNVLALANVKILARYYITPTYMAFIATAIWLSRASWLSHRRLVIGCTIAIGATNLAALSVGNKNPRPGERALAEALMRLEGPITTDPYTAARSEWYVRWNGIAYDRVVTGPPRKGQRFLYNPNNVSRPNRLISAGDLPNYKVDPSWPVLWSSIDPPPLLGRLAKTLTLDRFLPPTIRQKLVEAKPPVVLYEVTSDTLSRN